MKDGFLDCANSITIEDHMFVFFLHALVHSLIECGYLLVGCLESLDSIYTAKSRQTGNLPFAIHCTLQRWATQ
jgi:hypothetical protein